MQCQAPDCSKPATVHLTEITTGDEHIEFHYCEPPAVVYLCGEGRQQGQSRADCEPGRAKTIQATLGLAVERPGMLEPEKATALRIELLWDKNAWIRRMSVVALGRSGRGNEPAIAAIRDRPQIATMKYGKQPSGH